MTKPRRANSRPILRIKLWPYPRRLALFRDVDSYTAFLDRHCACTRPHEHRPDGHGQMARVVGTNIYALGIFDGSAATLVHELAHVVIDCFEDIGLPITHDASEAFCYLQAGLFGACANALWPDPTTKEPTPCPAPSPASPPRSRCSSRSPSASKPSSSTTPTPRSRARTPTSKPRKNRSTRR